jgi:bis(5'-nucleosyl)-tetraphosphatase (symmetrical)
MATYVIGDVQGCYDALQRLLERCEFGPKDKLWLTGDLVNRGPRSVDVLRFAMGLGKRCRAVLGNHDLHLLARAEGVADAKKTDTLEDVLDATDRDELLDWLRKRPFVVDADPWLLLHAGVLPAWGLEEVLDRAEHASSVLRSSKRTKMLGMLSNRTPPELDASREDRPVREAATTARILTNLRYCDRDGLPRLEFAGPPEESESDLVPWYSTPGRKKLRRTVLCGHWAAQGIRRTKNMVALDSGCVWGNRLSAFRIQDESLIAVSCRKSR